LKSQKLEQQEKWVFFVVSWIPTPAKHYVVPNIKLSAFAEDLDKKAARTT
jgi:hypothetical protein